MTGRIPGGPTEPFGRVSLVEPVQKTDARAACRNRWQDALAFGDDASPVSFLLEGSDRFRRHPNCGAEGLANEIASQALIVCDHDSGEAVTNSGTGSDELFAGRVVCFGKVCRGSANGRRKSHIGAVGTGGRRVERGEAHGPARRVAPS